MSKYSESVDVLFVTIWLILASVCYIKYSEEQIYLRRKLFSNVWIKVLKSTIHNNLVIFLLPLKFFKVFLVAYYSKRSNSRSKISLIIARRILNICTILMEIVSDFKTKTFDQKGKYLRNMLSIKEY